MDRLQPRTYLLCYLPCFRQTHPLLLLLPLCQKRPWPYHRLQADLRNRLRSDVMYNHILSPRDVHHDLFHIRLPHIIFQRGGGGVYQTQSLQSCGRFHVSPMVTQWWNHTKVFTMWLVITHVSKSNRRVACISTMQNILVVYVSNPSYPRILYSHAHFWREFMRCPTTASESSNFAVIFLPRQQNDNNIARGRPYNMKSNDAPSVASSFASLLSSHYASLR